jgi:Phosphatidylinositol N-acetylglucosaminyltransferase.
MTTSMKENAALTPTNLRRRKYPKLWEAESSCDEIRKRPCLLEAEGTEESFHLARTVAKEELLRFSILDLSSSEYNKPFNIRFIVILSKSLVVAQQFSMSVLFLSGHRCVVCRSTGERTNAYCNPCYRDDNLLISMHIFTATLTIIGICASIARQQNKTVNIQRKRDRFQNRSLDALIIAGTLRFLSSVLRTLTASYSSDTVAALAIGGMVCSVATADYNYANGLSQKASMKQKENIVNLSERQRPAFLGGTVSLNCVFFSAALLASRLTSDTMSYFFFMWTVIFFAYYPETRYYLAHSHFGKIGKIVKIPYNHVEIMRKHVIYLPFIPLGNHVVSNKYSTKVSCVAILGTSMSSLALLNDGLEKTIFIIVQSYILIITPLWKSMLLKQKVRIKGPWDIVSLKLEDTAM